MARRGDRIRCTVMFENEKVNDGKKLVPVMFTLNGRKIITQEGEEGKDGEDQFFIESDKPFYPYVAMSHGGSVLAKVRVKNGTQDLTRMDTVVSRRQLLFGLSRLFRFAEFVSGERRGGPMLCASGLLCRGLG